MTGELEPEAIFKSLRRCFAGRLDVKLTTGPEDSPLLKAAGQSFAMLYRGQLVVRLHPVRCENLIEAGRGQLLVLDGETLPEWFVVDGLDASEWNAHTMEALGSAIDW